MIAIESPFFSCRGSEAEACVPIAAAIVAIISVWQQYLRVPRNIDGLFIGRTIIEDRYVIVLGMNCGWSSKNQAYCLLFVENTQRISAEIFKRTSVYATVGIRPNRLSEIRC